MTPYVLEWTTDGIVKWLQVESAAEALRVARQMDLLVFRVRKWDH